MKHYWHALLWALVGCIPGLALYLNWELHHRAPAGVVVWLLLCVCAVVVEIRRGRKARA